MGKATKENPVAQKAAYQASFDEAQKAIKQLDEKNPAHTKVLVYPVFHHRDRRYHDFADRFAPDIWLPGGAAVGDWSFNPFGHGPMACPGRAMSLVLGTAALAEFLGGCRVRPLGGGLDPARRMPYQLNPLTLRLDLLPGVGGRRPGALSTHAV